MSGFGKNPAWAGNRGGNANHSGVHGNMLDQTNLNPVLSAAAAMAAYQQTFQAHMQNFGLNTSLNDPMMQLNKYSNSMLPSLMEMPRGGGRRSRSPRGGPRSRSRGRRSRSKGYQDTSFERRDRLKSDKHRHIPPMIHKDKPRSDYHMPPASKYRAVVPKENVVRSEMNEMTIKNSFKNLCLSSDLIKCLVRFNELIPITDPLPICHPSSNGCSFYLMPKDLEPPNEIQEQINLAVADPPDLDYSYSVKVMLMKFPEATELYKKCCQLAEMTPESKHDINDELNNPLHPTRLIHFITGHGKYENQAIGGAWSPSLDGNDPVNDPTVLINTAIRSTLALTGIDLSKCTKWYRFMELYYFRGSSQFKGKIIPSGVQNVVVFLPDVWKCVPTKLEWEHLKAIYKKKIEIAEISLKEQSTSSADVTTAEQSKTEGEENVDGGEGDGDGNDEMKKPNVDEKKKIIDEKVVKRMKQFYQLPEQPKVIVHPSPVAKSGKFDCTIKSLYELLKYSIESATEYKLEVLLFAEIFNEMLMRDFGFNIYKSLATLSAQKEQQEAAKKRKKSNEPETADDDAPAQKKEKKDDENIDTTSNGGGNGDETKGDNKSTTETTDSIIDEKKKSESVKSKKTKQRVGFVTNDPELLLSFVYFDCGRCGYLYSKDVHKIIASLGLDLSHSQINKIITSLTDNNNIYYRKITDMQQDLTDDGTTTENNGMEKKNDLNRPKRVREISPTTLIKQIQTMDGKMNDQQGGGDDDNKTGMITYKGLVINVEKILERQNEFEKVEHFLQTENQKFEVENKGLKKTNNELQRSLKHLKNDLTELKEKCYQSEKRLHRNETVSRLYLSTLKDIHHSIEPILKNEERRRKISEKKIDEAKLKSLDEKASSTKPSGKETNKGGDEHDEDILDELDMADMIELDTLETNEADLLSDNEKPIEPNKDETKIECFNESGVESTSHDDDSSSANMQTTSQVSEQQDESINSQTDNSVEHLNGDEGNIDGPKRPRQQRKGKVTAATQQETIKKALRSSTK